MKITAFTVKQKVMEIFQEIAGDRTYHTTAAIPSAQEAIEQALLADEYPPEVARDVAIHLTDWSSDANFIVAVRLFPERFTPDEIRIGVEQFIIHAPYHIAAAAKLLGWPVIDWFDMGTIDRREDDYKDSGANPS